MLEEFKEAEKGTQPASLSNSIDGRIREFVLPQWTVQVGFSLLLVGLGWVIGRKTGTEATVQVDATAYKAAGSKH
jgi:hypothetical protein